MSGEMGGSSHKKKHPTELERGVRRMPPQIPTERIREWREEIPSVYIYFKRHYLNLI
jgi:hypothetical protein